MPCPIANSPQIRPSRTLRWVKEIVTYVEMTARSQLVPAAPGWRGAAFLLHGSKLAGGFALTRTGERRWILVKTRDATALAGSDVVAERPASVRTGRTWEQVAAQADPGSSAL
jgi:hypothetical protein